MTNKEDNFWVVFIAFFGAIILVMLIIGSVSHKKEVKMEDIHYTKKDFKVDWFSGTGAGGQYRNKHQNCCRITHIESGLVSIATDRERTSNLRNAFSNLAKKVIAWTLSKQEVQLKIRDEVIRNYNENRNEVHDKASGLKMPYTSIVTGNFIAPMIEARRTAV